MECCCGSGTVKKTRVSKDSPFDLTLQKEFEIASQDSNVLQADPRKFSWGLINGTFGLAKQFHGKETSENPTSDFVEDIMAVCDITDLTRRKANIPPNHGIPELSVDVIVNAAPLTLDHLLLIPLRAHRSPQIMTRDLLLNGLQILEMSTRLDFRVLYNSLEESKAVNQFHYHGMYLNQIKVLRESRFPIEAVGRTNISGTATEGSVCIDMLAENEWYVRGFVLTAGCAPGTPGPEPAGDINKLADVTMRIVSKLQRKNIPHRLLLCPPPLQQRVKKILPTSFETEGDEIRQPEAISPEVYILPQKANEVRENAGSRLDEAISSTMGLVMAHTEEDFQNITEEGVRNFFSEAVSLPGPDFDGLICDVAWLVRGKGER